MSRDAVAGADTFIREISGKKNEMKANGYDEKSVLTFLLFLGILFLGYACFGGGSQIRIIGQVEKRHVEQVNDGNGSIFIYDTSIFEHGTHRIHRKIHQKFRIVS
ncbi:MAG: hypothetical protein LBT05_07265 [Planctomycetaceae bacterium]|nr:hypothetical protein [Planctomycetaceae bacterium]